MTTINLLPEDMRKKTGTPLKVLLPCLIGFGVILSAGALTAYVHFAGLSEARSEFQSAQDSLNQLAPTLKYEESLLREEAIYKKRADTITDIAKSRVLMTKRLDQVCGIINEGVESQDYLIWLTELKTVPAKTQRVRRGAKGPKPGGSISLRGYALADFDPLQDYNAFHAAVKNSEMFQEFVSLENPQGQIKHFSDDLVPGKGWTVDLTMVMRHPEDITGGHGGSGAAKVPEKSTRVSGSATGR